MCTKHIGTSQLNATCGRRNLFDKFVPGGTFPAPDAKVHRLRKIRYLDLPPMVALHG
jgi:hypothetical protein